MTVKSMKQTIKVEVQVVLDWYELELIYSSLEFKAEHGEQNSAPLLELRDEIEKIMEDLNKNYRR